MKHIQSLKTALISTGLGTFLVIGLSGCDSQSDKDKDDNHGSSFIPANSSNSSTFTSSSAKSSGFFGSGVSESVGG